MKADKGNCFVVLDSIDYNNKMNVLSNDRNTYELVSKSLFRRIERELINRLSTLKNQQKICNSTYCKLRSTDSIPPAIRVLSNNYFVYNDSVYKQIHGCAMGSPVSPVVANLCMEAIEEMAINTTPVPP